MNDSAEVLVELYQKLFENGVTPFYLHHADWTPGTFHFRTSIARGRQIMSELSGRISGPALPHYVLDLPGGDGKIPLMDTSRVSLKFDKNSDQLGAAVYQIRSSDTREGQKPVQYLEFFSVCI